MNEAAQLSPAGWQACKQMVTEERARVRLERRAGAIQGARAEHSLQLDVRLQGYDLAGLAQGLIYELS